MQRRLMMADGSLHASSLLEVDETEADDGEQHESDHEGNEDGNDLAPEVPFVVKVDR